MDQRFILGERGDLAAREIHPDQAIGSTGLLNRNGSVSGRTHVRMIQPGVSGDLPLSPVGRQEEEVPSDPVRIDILGLGEENPLIRSPGEVGQPVGPGSFFRTQGFGIDDPKLSVTPSILPGVEELVAIW